MWEKIRLFSISTETEHLIYKNDVDCNRKSTRICPEMFMIFEGKFTGKKLPERIPF